MAVLKKRYPINKKDFVHAGEASIHAKNLLKALKVPPSIMRRVAICAYEAEMNVVMHGGEGALSVEISDNQIVVDVRDNGSGIPDIAKAMEEGYSTAADSYRELGFGAGMGLPNMKRNADDFDISSEVGKGTQVRMGFGRSPKGDAA